MNCRYWLQNDTSYIEEMKVNFYQPRFKPKQHPMKLHGIIVDVPKTPQQKAGSEKLIKGLKLIKGRFPEKRRQRFQKIFLGETDA